MNSGPLDVASLCNAQPGHMYWKGWLFFQHIKVGVLTSKLLSIVDLILRGSSVYNENLPNKCLFSDDRSYGILDPTACEKHM